LKALGVDDVLRFPYVTRPPIDSLKAALRTLCLIGAL
jgi:HrpA-like RNA helicase